MMIEHKPHFMQINDGVTHSIESVNMIVNKDDVTFKMITNSTNSFELEVLTSLLEKQNKYYASMSDKGRASNLGIQLRLSIVGIMHTLDYTYMLERGNR